MRRHLALGLLFGCLLTWSGSGLGMAGNAPAGVFAYAITDLGTLGGPDSAATALSGNGLVVGMADGIEVPMSRAFLWQEGIGMTDLGEVQLTLPRVPRPMGVNDSGWVVADVSEPGTDVVGLFRDGEWTLLPFSLRNIVHGINSSGQIVATAGRSLPMGHAALYEDGVWTDLGTLPGDLRSSGGAINGGGQVVGSSASASGSRVFLWQRDTGMVDLGLPVVFSSGSAISENGLVAGSFRTETGETRPFLYRDGEMVDLGTLPDDESAQALGVNSLGQVVGITGSSSARRHAFLWQEGVGLLDLNDLIPSNSGWELIEARAINDAGQIVGSGRIGGETHAFLLDPVGAAKGKWGR